MTIEPRLKAWSHACTGVALRGPETVLPELLLMTIPAVLISTLIGALNGYALSHWRFRGSDALFSLLLVGCFIPFQVVLLPMARTLGAVGLSDSVWGLIFVHVVYGLAFTTLFFPQLLHRRSRRTGQSERPALMVPASSPSFAAFCCRSAGRSSWSASYGSSPRFGTISCSAWCSPAPVATGDRDAQQSGAHVNRCQRIQRRHGGCDHCRCADLVRLHRGGQIISCAG